MAQGLKSPSQTNKAMKKHIANKTSQTERFQNARLINDLIIAIMNSDMVALGNMLQEEYSYLNGRNKWATLHYFQTMTKMAAEQNVEVEIEEVTSMDYYPGCTGYKFTFREFMGGSEFPSRLTLVPVFEKGRLIDLAISKRFAPGFALEKLITNN